MAGNWAETFSLLGAFLSATDFLPLEEFLLLNGLGMPRFMDGMWLWDVLDRTPALTLYDFTRLNALEHFQLLV